MRSALFRFSTRSRHEQIETHRLTLTSRLPAKPFNDPKYKLSLDYVHSTNNGKSLLANRTSREQIPIRTVFDVNGVLSRTALEEKLAALERAQS